MPSRFLTSGRKFSTTTSARAAIFLMISTPRGCLRSSVIERNLFRCRFRKSKPSAVESPSISSRASILMTLAPMSASWRTAVGPERARSAGRMAEPVCEAGLRRVHFPASTAVRKSSTARLNASGSSRLIVWPDFGRTTSPAVGILRFMKKPGSRHGSSSSPVMISVGTVELLELGRRGRRSTAAASARRAWVSAWPLAEPAASCAWNSLPAERVLVHELHARRPLRVELGATFTMPSSLEATRRRPRCPGGTSRDRRLTLP